MEMKIGGETFASFKRLNYTHWHAMAEFIDNSTQSMINNETTLSPIFRKEGRQLEIRIVYDKKTNILRIHDNAMGMNQGDLESAFSVGKPPVNKSGRSRYGMGMKTAACWFGDLWTVTTKKLGDNFEYVATVDVEKLIAGEMRIPIRQVAKSPDEHYTTIEISKIERSMHGRRLNKMSNYLRSMYRADLQEGTLLLEYNGEVLQYSDQSENILVEPLTNTKFRKLLDFRVGGKRVRGWVAILDRGSRELAGFCLLHRGRVIAGVPFGFRPFHLFGQEGGSNDLINQRICGELHLDDFEVSHTKDGIVWVNEEEDEFGLTLKQHCQDYLDTARSFRKGGNADKGYPDERGPTDKQIAIARDQFNDEIHSPEMTDQVRMTEVARPAALNAAKHSILKRVREGQAPWSVAKIDGLEIQVYLERLSANDPYVLSEIPGHEVIVVINKNHPHWSQIEGESGSLNFVRHCVYDALAEWQAKKITSMIDPETVKSFKDGFLRIPMKIENHEQSMSSQDISPVK